MKPDAEIHSVVTDDKCEVTISGHTSDLITGICGTLKVLVMQIKNNMAESEVFPESVISADSTEDFILSYILSALIDHWQTVNHPQEEPFPTEEKDVTPLLDITRMMKNIQDKNKEDKI